MGPDVGTDRRGFLARMRAALGGTVAAAPHPAGELTSADWVERAERIRAEAARRWEELLPIFTMELQAVGGAVHRVSPTGVPALVSRLARERQLSRVVTWTESALGLPGLSADLRHEGLEVQGDFPPLDRLATPEAVQDIRRRLDQAEIGVTGVDFAVADSGSLVLLSGPGKDRLVSCLPIIHVAILRPGQLVGSLDEIGVLFEASHRQVPPGDSPSGITFIAGPSRTADIELSLTRGVHGPKEVHVIALS